MKCIHCGVELPNEAAYCLRCGTPTQIVPDYSIYDDDNIHVLLEGISEVEKLGEYQNHTEEFDTKEENQKTQTIQLTKEQYQKATTKIEQSTIQINTKKAESISTNKTVQNDTIHIEKSPNGKELHEKEQQSTNIKSEINGKQTVKDIENDTEDIILSKQKKQQRQLSQENQKKTKKQSQMLMGIVAGICVLLIIIGISVKVSVDYKNENSFMYQVKMAESFCNKKDWEQAAEYYIKAIALKPDNIDTEFALAEVYFASDKTKEAVALLKNILQKDLITSFSLFVLSNQSLPCSLMASRRSNSSSFSLVPLATLATKGFLSPLLVRVT